jgi:chromosome segregation ATPase
VINGQEEEKVLPILSIYFLGHKLEHISVPLIKVKRRYYDVATQQEINDKEEFIESLTHDSFIIQIPYLRAKYQSEAEQLLRVFDQTQSAGDHHILNIKEEDYPEKYQPLIRRLLRAVAEPKIRKTMDIEDQIVAELEDLDRQIARLGQSVIEKDQALAEKDQVLAENQQALAEKDQALAENQQALAEKDQVLAENQKALVEKDQVISQLRKKIGEQ